MLPLSVPFQLDLEAGVIVGAPRTYRYLRDLSGSFADPEAFAREAERANPLVYTVSSAETAQGNGQLHFGLGVLYPGRIGAEYYLTKGHFHAWRDAAEVYIGLRGSGLMLLEEEASGESRLLPLEPNGIVYVPGHTAHRTINTGTEPLVYLGVYPAEAGHDYGGLAVRNFRQVVVEQNGRAALLDRTAFRP